MREGKCCARVPMENGFGFRNCEFSGRVERDGKLYCGIHNPDKVARRLAKSVSDYNSTMAATKENARRLIRYDEAIRLLNKWLKPRQYPVTETKAFLAEEPK